MTRNARASPRCCPGPRVQRRQQQARHRASTAWLATMLPVSGWDFSNVFEEATFMVVPAVGYVLAARRPGNKIGWMCLGAGLVLGAGFFCYWYGQSGLVAAPGSLPGGPGGCVVLELGLADDSGCGIGVHSPAVPDRATVFAGDGARPRGSWPWCSRWIWRPRWYAPAGSGRTRSPRPVPGGIRGRVPRS